MRAELFSCPVCGGEVVLQERCVRCARGHSFDVARQGYVSLITGPARGDSTEMVRARAEFLASGMYTPIAQAIADIVRDCHPSWPSAGPVGTVPVVPSNPDWVGCAGPVGTVPVVPSNPDWVGFGGTTGTVPTGPVPTGPATVPTGPVPAGPAPAGPAIHPSTQSAECRTVSTSTGVSGLEPGHDSTLGPAPVVPCEGESVGTVPPDSVIGDPASLHAGRGRSIHDRRGDYGFCDFAQNGDDRRTPGPDIPREIADSAHNRTPEPHSHADTPREVAESTVGPTGAGTTCGTSTNPTRYLIADLGGGTGWYAAYLLDRLPYLDGVLLDASAAAARVAARAHPRLTVATADLWRSIPLPTGSVDLALVVFAPRNPAEIARILTPGGTCLVVTPQADHLAELRTLPILDIAPDKEVRLNDQFAEFDVRSRAHLRYQRQFQPQDIARVIAMGPSAFHLTGPQIDKLAETCGPRTVTISVTLQAYGFRPGDDGDDPVPDG